MDDIATQFRKRIERKFNISKYRILEPYEIVYEGDEIEYDDNVDFADSSCFGYPAHSLNIRRAIKPNGEDDIIYVTLKPDDVMRRGDEYIFRFNKLIMIKDLSGCRVNNKICRRLFVGKKKPKKE